MTDLLKLAERCEAATGEGRELDIAIALALPTWVYGGKPCRFFNAGPYYEGAPDRIGLQGDDWQTLPGNGPDMLVPAFTASIDAALTLVPERTSSAMGETVSVGLWDTNGVYPAHIRATAWVIGAPRTYAATPALALCAAALRARAASTNGGNQ